MPQTVQNNSSGRNPNQIKIAIAAGLFLVAGGVWYWTTRHERAFEAETLAALGHVVYRVQCSACNSTFEVPGREYVKNEGAEGIKCIKCGEKKAFRIGDAGDDPGQFREEMQKF